jgi:hypothetical protein
MGRDRDRDQRQNELPKDVKRTAICLGHLLPDITPEALVEPLAARLRSMSESGPMLTWPRRLR